MNKEEFKINFQIKSPQVRLIKDNIQLGIFSIDKARKLAQDEGLDLIEIVPNASPPICKIMNFGRFKYEKKMKQKEQQKKQRETKIQSKELRLRPGIALHDIETKTNQAKKFLEDGCKVQFNLQFKGKRELSHQEQGFAVMNKVIELLGDLCVIEKNPQLEGNRIFCSVSPKPK
jgi:translation initiation factor IF-3